MIEILILKVIVDFVGEMRVTLSKYEYVAIAHNWFGVFFLRNLNATYVVGNVESKEQQDDVRLLSGLANSDFIDASFNGIPCPFCAMTQR